MSLLEVALYLIGIIVILLIYLGVQDMFDDHFDIAGLLELKKLDAQRDYLINKIKNKEKLSDN